MERERFEDLVISALSELPEEFQERLENVDVVVQDYPDRKQRTRLRRDMSLLGLYEGVPHTQRTRGYNLALPDRITLFQKPIEAMCRGENEIAAEIRKVVRHEIAHHFGFDEESLRRIESRTPRPRFK